MLTLTIRQSIIYVSIWTPLQEAGEQCPPVESKGEVPEEVRRQSTPKAETVFLNAHYILDFVDIMFVFQYGILPHYIIISKNCKTFTVFHIFSISIKTCFGLYIFIFWTIKFIIWITHFVWTPCIRYTIMPSQKFNQPQRLLAINN